MLEVWRYCLSANLSSNVKIFLIIGRCAAHPYSESQGKDKVLFLPLNCALILQPMDMGILYFFKCNYGNNFLHHMLDSLNDRKNVQSL